MRHILSALIVTAFAFLTSVANASEGKAAENQPAISPAQQKLLNELRHLQAEVNAAENEELLVQREKFYKLLATTQSQEGGKFVADAIWRNWIASAPTDEVRKMITDAMERRRWYDYEGAREILNKAVEAAPEYSEAWNQRAYILFLQEKFDASLEDLDKALALEPRHFGALAGKARIHFHQGDPELAQIVLKKAVGIHPWLYERILLAQPPASGQEPAENKVGEEL